MSRLNIFLTVGTQFGFDRLVIALDEWLENKANIEVFGQIGRANYLPKRFEFKSFLTLEEYELRVSNCDLILAHAGMGSIITALTRCKPILIVPRLEKYKEHRNNHQVDTAKKFENYKLIRVAYDMTSLVYQLNHWDFKLSETPIDKVASDEMISAIKNIIDN